MKKVDSPEPVKQINHFGCLEKKTPDYKENYTPDAFDFYPKT
jgi:hypothetical protein